MDLDGSRREGHPRPRKFLIGGAIVVVTLAGLVVWAMARPNSTSSYVTPTTVAAAEDATEMVRLTGTVAPGSIERDGLSTEFMVADATSEVAVVTDAPLPDAFRDRSEVIVSGYLEGERFVAAEVWAKCPSKFKARA